MTEAVLTEVVEPVADAIVEKVADTPVAVEVVAEPDAGKIEETKVKPTAKVEPPKVDWREKVLAKKTAKVHELTEKLKAFENSADDTKSNASIPTPSTQEFNEAVDRVANERAQAIAATTAFDRACVDVLKQGNSEFDDFSDKLTNFQHIVDQNDQAERGKYATFVSAAIETGDAARILYTLAGDLDQAQRIMDMHPIKMAIELTKLSAGTATRREISNAPSPIKPLGKTQTQDAEIKASDPLRSDKLSTKTWMERRQAEADATWQRDNPRKRA